MLLLWLLCGLSSLCWMINLSYADSFLLILIQSNWIHDEIGHWTCERRRRHSVGSLDLVLFVIMKPLPVGYV